MRKFALCYLLAMSTAHPSAIRRLVDHHGGPTKVAALLGGDFPYQIVQQWVQREWASPLHFQRLAPLMPKGMKLPDLYEDIKANKAPRKAAKVTA